MGNLMGRRIRELRLEKGLSQEELGRIVGVKRAAVNKWETGQVKNLRRDTIETLSRFFDVSPSYLMGMTDIRLRQTVGYLAFHSASSLSNSSGGMSS